MIVGVSGSEATKRLVDGWRVYEAIRNWSARSGCKDRLLR